jgi:uncharacterized protein (DUF2384 family)
MEDKDELLELVLGTPDQRTTAHQARIRSYIRAWSIEPVRTPRGLDAVIAALPDDMSHSKRVALVHTPQPDLDGFTPVEWLADDGAAYEVITVLTQITGATSPAVLVAKLRTLLGAKLIAYLASVDDTSIVRHWAQGTKEPNVDVVRRLSAAFHTAFILSGYVSAAEIQAWMQGANPILEDMAPAQLLREDPVWTGWFGVLAAARTHVAQAERRLDPDAERVLARTQELFAEPSATEWLFGTSRHLNGARPIDLMILGRCEAVLDALDGVEQNGMG